MAPKLLADGAAHRRYEEDDCLGQLYDDAHELQLPNYDGKQEGTMYQIDGVPESEGSRHTSPDYPATNAGFYAPTNPSHKSVQAAPDETVPVATPLQTTGGNTVLEVRYQVNGELPAVQVFKVKESVTVWAYVLCLFFPFISTAIWIPWPLAAGVTILTLILWFFTFFLGIICVYLEFTSLA